MMRGVNSDADLLSRHAAQMASRFHHTTKILHSSIGVKAVFFSSDEVFGNHSPVVTDSSQLGLRGVRMVQAGVQYCRCILSACSGVKFRSAWAALSNSFRCRGTCMMPVDEWLPTPSNR